VIDREDTLLGESLRRLKGGLDSNESGGGAEGGGVLPGVVNEEGMQTVVTKGWGH